MDGTREERVALVVDETGEPHSVAFPLGRPGLYLARSTLSTRYKLLVSNQQGSTFEIVSAAGGVVVLQVEGGKSALVRDMEETIPDVAQVCAIHRRSRQVSPIMARLRRPGSGQADQLEVLELEGDVGDYIWRGAPVLSETGVVAIVTTELAREPDGQLRLAILPIRAIDHAILKLLGYLPPMSKPRAWIRVSGSYQADRHNATLAASVGGMLARAGYGLIHGGSTGIDVEVRKGFLSECQDPRRSRIVGQPQWLLNIDQVSGEGVSGLDSELSDREFIGDALIVFEGGGGTLGVARRALRAGIATIPLGSSGRYPRALLQQILDQTPGDPFGLPRARYEALASLEGEDLFALVEELLDLATSPSGDLDRSVEAISDQPRGKDLLGVRPQARRFADLIVARDLKPPFAIGLLGEWGAGKSFFVRELHDAIKQERGDDEICKGVVQVQFNAWHYVDCNLWASLACRLFEGIAEKLGLKEATPSQAREKLQKELKSTKRERAAADADLQAAKSQLVEAQKERDRARREREAQLTGIRALADEGLRHSIRDDPSFQSMKTEGLRLAQQLGLWDVFQAATSQFNTLQTLVADLRSAPTLIRALTRVPASSASFLIYALLAMTVLGLVFSVLFRSASPLELAAVLELLTATGAAINHVGRVTNIFVTLLRRAQDLVDRGEQLRRDALMHESEAQAKAAISLANAEAVLAVAEARVAELEALAARTSADLAELDAGKLVYRLVESRVASSSAYRAGEGLISLFRRDLEALSLYLKDQREVGAKDPMVERVVLYIDDLDRCPPGQVIQVLQAVHLLLAFDLFVVVVAVDPRWLERALEHEYAALLGGPAHDRRRHIDAHDYLEKIFQIPYTLAPVEDDGFRRMIEEYLPVAGSATVGPPKVGVDERDTSSIAEVPAGSAGGSASDATADKAPLLASRTFRIDANEQRFMQRLSKMVDTPRSVKRFINVYRLLRAGVPADRVAQFKRGDYRIVQLQLAASIAYPRAGAAMLRRLSTMDTDSLKSWADLDPEVPWADRALVEEAHRLRTAIGPFEADLQSSLTSFPVWASAVGQYSFFWRWEE